MTIFDNVILYIHKKFDEPYWFEVWTVAGNYCSLKQNMYFQNKKKNNLLTRNNILKSNNISKYLSSFDSRSVSLYHSTLLACHIYNWSIAAGNVRVSSFCKIQGFDAEMNQIDYIRSSKQIRNWIFSRCQSVKTWIHFFFSYPSFSQHSRITNSWKHILFVKKSTWNAFRRVVKQFYFKIYRTNIMYRDFGLA